MSGWQQRLLSRVREGDPAALEQIYDRLAGGVYRTARLLTGSEAAAESVTLAVFLQVWRSPDAFCRDHEQLGTHLALATHTLAHAWVEQRPPHPPETCSVPRGRRGRATGASGRAERR